MFPYAFWDYWVLYHKVTFDGANKLIIINDGVASLNIKTDVYSDWKEWARLGTNLKYLHAMSAVGGQPLPGGGFLGDTYFLENGWKLKLTGSVEITGNLYTSDATSPFVTAEGIQIARSTVSQLVQTVSGDAQNISNTVWANAPDNSSTYAEAVWSITVTDKNTPNTTGNKLRQGLTRNQFIALK